mmetsp:Transcript_9175/g.14152  ORF Transcript_9175/g.14152 Transcript_9175/m.14152 type:complete len:209 (-) Transcript_9175:3185-3811(-)
MMSSTTTYNITMKTLFIEPTTTQLHPPSLLLLCPPTRPPTHQAQTPPQTVIPNSLQCPVPGCPTRLSLIQTQRNVTSLKAIPIAPIFMIHPFSIAFGIHICHHPTNCQRSPCTKIFNSASSYERHRTACHPSPPSSPSTTTLSIDLSSIYTDTGDQPDRVSTCLRFHLTTLYPVQPPNFRHTWLHFLKHRNAATFTSIQASLYSVPSP